MRKPPEINSKYFYDDRGSMLFERICELPEYYPTRTERSLLERIAGRVTDSIRAEELVELGPGGSTKNRLLLDKMAEAGRLRRYVPLDTNETVLRRMAEHLADRYSGLHVHGLVGDFTQILECVPRGNRRLITFLGGTIGNSRPREAVSFLSRIAALMGPDDGFLLGMDLIKDTARLEAAYNDSAGVTAAFNQNILHVMNRRVGADFEPDHFRHRAFYNSKDHWIEMRLVSTRIQTVRLPAIRLELSFRTGDEILTEISAKYDRDRAASMLARAGLRLIEWYADPENLFALSLARR